MPADRKPPLPAGARPRRTRVPPPAGALGVEEEIARLKRQIWENQRIWEGFRQIEVRLIGARSLRDLVLVLTAEFPRIFPTVDCVTLACFDPEYELTRLLEGPAVPDASASAPDLTGCFVNVTQESLRTLFAGSRRPRLGPCTPDIQALLFPAYPQPLGSVALAPLVLRDQVIGTLNQGSLDADHFAPDAATDLLEHLAAVTAMCIDNAVSRERLRLYSLLDPLTGVANRRLFEHRLGDEIERWLRRHEPLVYMLVDIDHFKRINDGYGHHAGDQVLQQVAAVLNRDLRRADLLGRYGGEEFMLLFPATTLAQGAAIARRLCGNIAAHKFSINGKNDLTVTVSIGVAGLGADDQDKVPAPARWLFEQADRALYAAKQGGRNRVVVAGGADES
ncbi:MAG TPA: DUF484 family protein [Burkholderiales bacterium]